MLPPKAVDTPEELAELSQFLVNVIDFRDPDCTMTHFRNPDVKVVLGSIAGTVYNPTYLAPIGATIPATNTAIPLDQYGMEYNPIAINEALAFSFQTGVTPPAVNRFYVELVNTLSQTAIGLLPAGDFGTGVTNPPDVSTLDLSLANYDMVMTADDPVSRPDPFTGQLLPIQSANYYGQLPFNQANSTTIQMFNPAIRRTWRRAAHAWLLGRGTRQSARHGRLPGQLLLRHRQPPLQVMGAETGLPAVTATLTSAYDPLQVPSPTPPPAAPANVVPPGYCPNLASIAVAPATVSGRHRQAAHDAAECSAGRGQDDGVLLGLPAPAGQSVRAAPARPDDRRPHGPQHVQPHDCGRCPAVPLHRRGRHRGSPAPART